MKKYPTKNISFKFDLIDITDQHLDEFPFLLSQYSLCILDSAPTRETNILLKAFKASPNKKIVIVAEWNKTGIGRLLKRKFNNYINLYLINTFSDPIKKSLLIQNAKAFIQLSTNKNNIGTLLTILKIGLPVIALNTITNKLITMNKAVYFNQHNDLIKVISQMTLEQLRNIASANNSNKLLTHQ